MSNIDKAAIDAIRFSLSHARIATFENAVVLAGCDDPAALGLYAWNASVSGALFGPLQVCEVVLRNAVSDALSKVYGESWPWNATFEGSLPLQRKIELNNSLNKNGINTTGKLIPELSFFFWQSMFTARHDSRIWIPHMDAVLPNLDKSLSIQAKRLHVYNELDQIRVLRNRIAHHEPIFSRNLLDDYNKIIDVIKFRCVVTASWLDSYQLATNTIKVKP